MLQAITDFVHQATDFLALLGIHFVSVLAGSLGAAASAFRGTNRTRKERIISFVVGCGAAWWAPGLVIGWLGLPSAPGTYGVLSFALGYFGMALADAAMQFDWRAIFESWMKKK